MIFWIPQYHYVQQLNLHRNSIYSLVKRLSGLVRHIKSSSLNDTDVAKIVSFGDHFAARMVYGYYRRRGVSVEYIPSTDFVVTDNIFGKASIAEEDTLSGIVTKIPTELIMNQVLVTENSVGQAVNTKRPTIVKDRAHVATLLGIGLNAPVEFCA